MNKSFIKALDELMNNNEMYAETKDEASFDVQICESQFNDALKECEADLVKLQKVLRSIYGDDLPKTKREKTETFLSKYEYYFLRAKQLNRFLNEDSIRMIAEIVRGFDDDEAGTTNWFKDEFIVVNDDYFVFILPETIGFRNYKQTSSAGQFHEYITRKHAQKYIEKTNYLWQKMETALVVFEHHFDSNSPFNNTFDPDNYDSKRALDGINGLLIEDDTIRNINLVHVSFPDKKTYTKLHLIRGSYIKDWIEENASIFYQIMQK